MILTRTSFEITAKTTRFVAGLAKVRARLEAARKAKIDRLAPQYCDFARLAERMKAKPITRTEPTGLTEELDRIHEILKGRE